ncbi:MAG: hypothetical protein WBG27_02775 [Candidatus Aquilonibacter sp.]
MFAVLRSARLTAFAATLGLILKTFFGKELLLASGKNELVPTVLARDHLVFHRVGASGAFNR